LITLEWVYRGAALLFAAYALMAAREPNHPRRWRNAGFWGLMAVSFGAGSVLGDHLNGGIAIGLALLAGRRGLGHSQDPEVPATERAASAARFGDRLFGVALVIPAGALAGSLLLSKVVIFGVPLIEPANVTLVSLGLSVLIALAVAMKVLGAPARAALVEGRRLMDSVGWAAVLPQMLAALGGVFAVAGLGDAVGAGLTRALTIDTTTLAVAVYCIGMAAFTIVMGNTFAAFPVMTVAVGLPLVIRQFGGDPAIVCAIGMLSGFCGTLVTPMAANFNVVPASLLELPDRDALFNGVIRAQWPTALCVLFANMVLMRWLAF